MTDWKQANTTKYIEMLTGTKQDLGIDLFGELATGDSISTVTFVSTTGMTITEFGAYTDQDGGHTIPHIAMAYFETNTVGLYPVKLTATTNQGKTSVYHFDILVKE